MSNIENFELQTVSIANSNINIGKNQLIHKERNEDVKLIDEKLFLFSNIESLKEDEDGSKEIYNEKFEIRNKGLEKFKQFQHVSKSKNIYYNNEDEESLRQLDPEKNGKESHFTLEIQENNSTKNSAPYNEFKIRPRYSPMH